MHPIARLLIGHVLLANSIAAMAQETPAPAAAKSALQERLRDADANGDRYIDRQEAAAKLPRIAKNFDRLDGDDDGRLSAEELQAVASRLGQMRR